MNLDANVLTMEMDGITYIVSTHFSDSEETVLDKLTRLVSEDENIMENPFNLAHLAR